MTVSMLDWLQRERGKLKERLAKCQSKEAQEYLRREIALLSQKILALRPGGVTEKEEKE